MQCIKVNPYEKLFVMEFTDGSAMIIPTSEVFRARGGTILQLTSAAWGKWKYDWMSLSQHAQFRRYLDARSLGAELDLKNQIN